MDWRIKQAERKVKRTVANVLDFTLPMSPAGGPPLPEGFYIGWPHIIPVVQTMNKVPAILNLSVKYNQTKDKITGDLRKGR